MLVRPPNALLQRPAPTPSSGRVGTVNQWAMHEADNILRRVVMDALTSETHCSLQHTMALTLIRVLGQMDARPGSNTSSWPRWTLWPLVSAVRVRDLRSTCRRPLMSCPRLTGKPASMPVPKLPRTPATPA